VGPIGPLPISRDLLPTTYGPYRFLSLYPPVMLLSLIPGTEALHWRWLITAILHLALALSDPQSPFGSQSFLSVVDRPTTRSSGTVVLVSRGGTVGVLYGGSDVGDWGAGRRRW
jgi:hypothetical protein